MKLIATKPMRYGARSLKADEAFEASARDARILLAIGSARAAEEAAAPKAESDDDKRRYKRRDMRPEN